MSSALLLEFVFKFSDKFFFWAGIVFLILDLIGKNIPLLKKRLEEKVTHHWFLGFSAICLLVASFQVWNEERERAERAEYKVEELSKPILSSELGEVGVAPNGSGGQDCVITVQLNVRNQGAPTGLDKFDILVSQGAKTYVSELLRPANTVLYSGVDKRSAVISLQFESNLIHAASQPIERNSAKPMWVQVYVHDLRKPDVPGKTQITFIYHDIATNTLHQDSFPANYEQQHPLTQFDLERQSRQRSAPSR